MKARFRILKLITISLVVIVVVLLVGGLILSRVTRSVVDKELKAAGITIKKFDVNLFTRSVTVGGFNWVNKGDSATSRPSHLSLKEIRIEGIHIIELIRNKRVECSRILLVDGDLLFNKNVKSQSDTSATKKQKSFPLNGLAIEKFIATNIGIQIVSDTINEMSGTLSAEMQSLSVPEFSELKQASGFEIGSVKTEIRRFRNNSPESMYRFAVGRISINTSDQAIIVDSIAVIPKYSRYRFSRKLGKQKDRLVLVTERLAITGFQFDQLRDSLFIAKKVSIEKASLQIYKDKRLPFIRDHNVPLPIAQLRQFKFGFAIDTIDIIGAKIAYEEFPEKGYHPGKITFSNLNAKLDHIHNRDYFPDYKQATLTTKSNVMEKGTIDAVFTLPYGKAQIYTANGAVRNLAMHRLNPIMENLAFISFDAGTLNELKFNFDYDDLKSTGMVLINYENLKVRSLTREKDPDKNGFKTWLFNLFLKKDKDEDVKIEKRTGKIEYERERRKAIFVVWVKSLMSGLKSSVIDSPGKKDPEDLKAERRKKENDKK